MHRVVIAGGGFGGIATAAALRRQTRPSELEVVLVDRRRDFVMGLRKSWAVLRTDTLEAGLRDLQLIEGVEFTRGEIHAIDPAGRSVTTAERTIAGDALVLSLGARHDMSALPGLVEHGINPWDRDEVSRAAAAIGALQAGQRLVIGIFGLPYSCPPAPFELALMARDRLGPDVAITVFGPAPIALPVIGPNESAKVERMLIESAIGFLPKHQAVAVDPGRVQFADGTATSFDVLLAIPPHRVPQVLVAAGLAQPDGWIKPDPRTLETGHPGVYAIGDCTAIPLANGLALPKAGIFAQLEGEVVAARILERLSGREPTATFTGQGYCFVETGGGKAAKASGAFLDDPVAVTIAEPSTAGLEEKHAFEQSRLKAWFGAS